MKRPLLTRARRFARRQLAKQALARRKRAYRAGRPVPPAKTVVFIIGCQRSGTNMTQEVLDQMSEIDSFEERDRRAFRRCRILGLDVRDRLIERSAASCVTFKPICDSHNVLDLMAQHPGSKAVWVYRRWRDVVNSSVRLWDEHWQHVIGDLLNGGKDWGWRHEAVSERTLADLRKVYRPEMTSHECMSLFWYLRNQVYYDLDLPNNPDAQIVRYEAMVTEPQDEFGRICRFLGVPYEAGAADIIFASSIGKERNPVDDPALTELCDRMQVRLDESWEQARTRG